MSHLVKFPRKMAVPSSGSDGSGRSARRNGTFSVDFCISVITFHLYLSTNLHQLYTGINYTIVENIKNILVPVGEGGGILMLVKSAPLQTISINPGYLRAKRVLDISFTLLISPLLLFISAVVIMLILLDSKGPVLFRQKRVGRDGIEFDMFKFRSMYVNSDDTIHHQAIKQYMNGERLNGDAKADNPYKLDNDPRITRIGKILRKTSIDELPQFWNVLRGEMTLIGPRPPLPYEVKLYTSHDWLRLSGKPGLAGLWQVYGRSQVSFQEMVEMDIAYLQHQSLWEDVKLIALTVPVMLQGRGGA